jgi:uncharacterized protein (TIGR03435 family)
MRVGRVFVLGIVAALAAIPVLPQEPVSQKPSFEVASVKRNASGYGPSAIATPGCRFVATNVLLKMLVRFAYNPASGGFLPMNQIVGGPSWVDTDRFDVQAKPEGNPQAIPETEMALMAQSLLEDRFKLHLEMRDLPVYDLVVGKDGPNIKLSQDQTPPQAAEPSVLPCAQMKGPAPPGTPPPPGLFGPRGELPRGGSRVLGTPGPGGILMTVATGASPLSAFVGLIRSYAGRPIIDKTGLKGLYDIQLQFGLEAANSNGAPAGLAAPPPDPPGPSIFTAIQDIGLKLESAKGPVKVLVIDDVQRPSEN